MKNKFERQNYSLKEKQRVKKLPSAGLSPDGQGWVRWKPIARKIYPGLSCGWQVPLLSQVYQQGTGSKVEQVGLEPVPTQDAGIGGRGLTSCTTTPAPKAI